MRSEKEMFDLLISTAREDENILAAYLEGSRTVPEFLKIFSRTMTWFMW